MKLDEAEREIFDKLTQEYIDEFGIRPLMAVYRLHRKYSNKLCYKDFPVRELRDHLLFIQLKDPRFEGLSFHQIAATLKDEVGISEKSFYNFYHQYYKPRLKEESKQRRCLK